MENSTGCGSRAALQLGFDAPGKVWAIVLAKDLVCDEAVRIFRVDEEAIHIEDAGSDGGETGHWKYVSEWEEKLGLERQALSQEQ